MAGSIQVRAQEQDGVVEVKTLIRHPMESGFRKDDQSGEPIPAHYIQEVVVTHEGKVVMQADWGTAVSRNPYLSFRFKGGKKGDKITVRWVDNKGQTDSVEAEIQ